MREIAELPAWAFAVAVLLAVAYVAWFFLTIYTVAIDRPVPI